MKAFIKKSPSKGRAFEMQIFSFDTLCRNYSAAISLFAIASNPWSFGWPARKEFIVYTVPSGAVYCWPSWS